MIIQHNNALSQINIPSSVDHIPAIPDPLGFAGTFAGSINNDILVAGGANFPNKMPWEGGVKVWYDVIYLLKDDSEAWEKLELKLPEKLAYGITASYENGIILVGGTDEDNLPSNRAWFVSKPEGDWSINEQANMPIALANMTGGLVGDYLFIAGGSTHPDGTPTVHFFAYHLKSNSWLTLPSIPGPARVNAVSSTAGGHFYLFSGIEVVVDSEGVSRNVLTDAYRFIPDYEKGELIGGKWDVLADLPQGVAAGPSPAPVIDDRYVLIFGGLDQQTAQHLDPESHPGFLPNVLKYDVIDNSWEFMGTLPKREMRLTLPGLSHKNSYLLISGEIGPGVRTNTILTIDLNTLKYQLK